MKHPIHTEHDGLKNHGIDVMITRFAHHATATAIKGVTAPPKLDKEKIIMNT